MVSLQGGLKISGVLKTIMLQRQHASHPYTFSIAVVLQEEVYNVQDNTNEIDGEKKAGMLRIPMPLT